jgi:4-alpha-glucanotransferase
MSARAKLRRLGQLYGIEPGYTDIWGRRRRVSATTERAVLEAMGIAAGSEREIAGSLREAEALPWRRLLAPVRVVAPPDPPEVTFSLPLSRAGARVRWSLVEEAGDVHEGEAAIDDLPAVGEADVAGERYRRWRLRLPHDLPLGYHQLDLSVGGAAREAAGGSSGLIIAPARCFLPEDEPDGGRPLWGFACQLYGLRSGRNWGMGDFTDLARLAEQAAGLGAAAIGINPLHALFPADASHISPYSPSSRLFLNVLYIDPEAVPELAESPEAQAMLAGDGFQAELASARGAELVDYPAVARLKLPLLEHLYAAFRRRDLVSPASARGEAFRAFVDAMGAPLERHVLFDALHEHAIRHFGAWAWQHWPEPYRHPDSPEVAAFAAEHRERVEFFGYLQWLADGQLADAQARARVAGMPIGLYQDLAVAVNPASSVAWANPGVSLSEVSAGAPPDWFNQNGQNWVLSPLSPVGLRESRYAMFVEALRHNMRHAGAVRIDHVMGLKRLFWIPAATAAS